MRTKTLLISLLLFTTALIADWIPRSTRVTQTDPLGVQKAYQNNQYRSTAPDTLRLLALRAEFVQDDLKTTTGDGTFDLSSESNYVIDRPPHNRTYFQHQLLALRNYFATISNGRLIIESTVLPEGENDSYKLSEDMVYYSGLEDEELQKQRWAELLRDAVNIAADEDGPSFDDYDMFVVFHAGVGADISFDFDTTPYDIQSAFIDLETLRETIGNNDPDYEGIPAGGAAIQEGLILPETMNQEEINFGLLGVMTLLMGSQVGMPSLYNTEDGSAGIGQWGLMDQGSFNIFGLVPAYPSAWTRMYMGWDEPVVMNSVTDAVIASINAKSAPHLVKIPINASEYFLLENRQDDWNGDNTTFGRDQQGRRIQFDSTKVNFTVESGLGVVTSIDEYDFGIPGSGILIWHIDDRVIAENLASNTINDNPERRGVDLVECDGPQDIGQNYGLFTAGYGTSAGDYWDPYWNDNISHMYVNARDIEIDPPITAADEELLRQEIGVELSADRIPNSNTNDGAKSHIRIYDFSASDSLMTFSVSGDLAVDGFPRYLGNDVLENGVVLIENGVAAVTRSGMVLAWNLDGTKKIANDDSATITSAIGDSKSVPLAVIYETGEALTSAPLVVDFAGDGRQEFVLITTNGKAVVLGLRDNDSDGRADLLAEFETGVVPASDLMMAMINGTPSVVAGTADGRILRLSNKDSFTFELLNVFDGDQGIVQLAQLQGDIVAVCNDGWGGLLNSDLEILWEKQILTHPEAVHAVTADFNGDSEWELLVYDTAGQFVSTRGDGRVLYSGAFKTNETLSAPALGDVDQDGLPELLVSGRETMMAFQFDGAAALNFPVSFQAESDPLPALFWESSAAATSLTAHGSVIRTFNSKGLSVEGFPLSSGYDIVAAPVISSETAMPHLFIADANGRLQGFKLWENDDLRNTWLMPGGNAQRSFSLAASQSYQSREQHVMPTNRVFCYPNPTYDGQTYIRYTLNRGVDKVSIRIFDIAGEWVADLTDTPAGAGDHEVVWNVANVQSGSYLARVEAEYGSDSVIEFIKIAVVK